MATSINQIEKLEREDEVKSGVLTAIVAGLLFCALWFWKFTSEEKIPETGIEINFGTADQGSGEFETLEEVAEAPPETSQEIVEEVTPPSQSEPVVEENVMTEKTTAKVPAIKSSPKPNPNKNTKVTPNKNESKKSTNTSSQSNKSSEKKAAQLNSKFSGLGKSGTGSKKGGRASTGQGDGDVPGNQGNPEGGLTFGLGGRKLLSWVPGSVSYDDKTVQMDNPCPDSAPGNVRINYWVDAKGNVSKAMVDPAKTKTTDSCLRNAALSAVKNHVRAEPGAADDKSYYDFPFE